MTTPLLLAPALVATALAIIPISSLPAEGSARPEWENEQINSFGNEPARATSVPSPTLEMALTVPYVDEVNPWVQSLNGNWKFHWVPKPEERPVDFYQMDYDVSDWTEIPVPSNMEIEGYGKPIYISADYAFKISYPEPIVTAEPPKEYSSYEERNPVGSYRREFTLDDDWEGRDVYLHFGGGGAAYYVWINGERVGYYEDSFSPAEFRVTDFVRFGKPNVIAVELYRWADGSYLEDQDFFRLSGLFRDVFLWSSDPVQIRDFFVTTDLDDTYVDAALNAEVAVRNLSSSDRRLIVRASLYDADANLVSTASTEIQLEAAAADTLTINQLIADPAKWSAESPSLYTTVIELSDGDDPENMLDRRSCQTGFREIEIDSKKQLLVNGQPVILKGVNRHGHDPETGQYERAELLLQDVLLMKRNNVNCVRTAHYPNDPRFYALLDEYGIYAIDEANIESHGLLMMKDESVSYDPKWEQAYLDRALTMVERDKNHPSVIIWSMGNEGGGGQNYELCVAATRERDATRLVFYDGFHDDHEFSDLDGSMYVPLPRLVADYGEKPRNKPYFHTEYGHSQGNSLGNLQEYVDAYETYDHLIGGAIWDWVDQALWVTRDDGSRYLGYGGSWDELPTAKNFGLNGIIFADRSQAPRSAKLAEVRKAYQPVRFEAVDLAEGEVRIANLNDFTNLAETEVRWSLSEEGTVTDSGVLRDFSLAPGEERTAVLPWFQDEPTLRPDREYFLRVAVSLATNTRWAERGYELASAQFLLPTGTEPIADLLDAGAAGSLSLEEDDDRIRIIGDGFEVAFDRTTGLLASVQRDGATLLDTGSGDFHASRALTDNDFLMFDRSWFTQKYWAKTFPEAPQPAALELTSLDAQLVSLGVADRSAERVRIVVDRTYATAVAPWKFDVKTVWDVHPGGIIVSTNTVDTNLPAANRDYLTSAGFNFVLASKFDQFTYYGAGPHENYPDRRRSADIGVYESSVADLFVPYPKSQDFGNRESVRWLALTDTEGQGALFLSDDPQLSASAKHYTRAALMAGENIADVAASPEVHVDLNFAQLGLGNGSCGECRPLDAYLTGVAAKEMFSYAIVLVDGDDDLGEIGRRSIQPLPTDSE